MSDSRVNKQAQVNFHPTASNVVSALNGSHWDGSTLKRPVFFLPLSDETQSGATTTAADYSGNGNDGVIVNATASISYAHDDTPWGNRYRKGIHKGSFLLQRLGRSGESGATAGYDFAGTDGIASSKTTYVRLPTNLKHTGSSGTPNTLPTAKRFSQGYTFSCWFKPDSKLFERGEQAGKPHMVALFDLSGSARLMYNVEAGTLNFENDALDGSGYDFRASTIKRKLFKSDRWHHVVLSQDRKPSDSDQGGTYRKPRIYLNGKRLELTGTTHDAGDDSMHDSAGILKIHLGIHSSPRFVDVETSNSRNLKNFPGKVCHFIGWNSQLDDRDIYTIYGASLGAYERKSGNLDIIPLLERQFIKDNKTGSYPTIQRSGIDNRHGSYRSFYDDRNTVVFKKHVDIFPGEINKIKKGQVLEENLMGWWRFQELLNTASNPSQWQGRYKIGNTLYNEVSEDFPAATSDYIAHKNALPGISTQRVIDSGPNALSGTLFGDASFTTDVLGAQTRLFTTSSKGPFPKPKDDDIKLMSPDQLVRWGGRKALYLPQTGSKAAFVQFTDQNKPKLRFIRSLKNGTLRDKPWTMSMWFKVEDKGHTVDAAGSNDDPLKDYHGIFRIENASSGTVSRARIARDNFTGRWQIKWWVYGMDDDTQLASTASVQTNYLVENGLNLMPSGSTGSLPNRGLPEGWHHLAFVYRGGSVKTSEGHWKGRVRSLFKAGSSILLPLNTGKRIQGGRMQIWMDGKQLVTSASLTDIENFKRVSENSAKIADGKKIIFGHYRTPGYRVTASTSISGSFSGSIAEVALFNKALKKPGLNRIINNGRFIPEINVADYPMMLDRHHPTMDRMPVTDIKTFGSTRPGISDTRITFTKGDELQPFDDRKTLVATGSNLIGTPASISPDLEAPLGSKASFTVNITPKDDVVLMKFIHTGGSYNSGSLNADHWRGIGRSTLRALARDQGAGLSASAHEDWWNDQVGQHGGAKVSTTDSSLENLPGFVRKGGPIEIGDYTGFVYYNFEAGKWEQMGLYDPVSKIRIHYDYASTVNLHHGLGTVATSASGSYPQQFKPAPYNRTAGPELDEQSYSSTGRPSLHAMAPYATKYHATSSQVIRVSDYIKQPFLLERVRVELPVAAFKAFGGDDATLYTAKLAPDSGGPGSRFNDVGRVMNRQIHAEDSMVFFMYRQTRPKSPLRPSALTREDAVRHYSHPTIVSGSNRFLICSGVATFYNDHRHAPGYIDDHGLSHTSSNYPTPYELKHTPAWSYNWAQKLVTSSAEWDTQVAAGTQDGVFTGSIIMDIKPAVQGRTPLGNFHVFGGGNFARGVDYAQAAPGSDDGGPASKVSLKLIGSTLRYKDVGIPTGYWPGGTSWKGIFPKKITGRSSNLGESGQGTLGGSVYADFIENKVKDSGNQYMLTEAVLDDPRTIVMPGSPVDIGSDASPQHALSGSGDDPTQKQHPYLLLPEDELIFGLDYLPTIVFGALQANELSGSHIKLLSTGSATVTFYGSFFKQGKPYTPSLNQNLTSNAVHEVIGNDPVVDEYMINTRAEYTGSYIDNLMRGGPPGIKGLVDGYHGGRFSLAYSGNMAARPRFRQSIVGEDYFKMSSKIMSIMRSGSLFETSASLGRMFLQFGNTRHGGPSWGIKHDGGIRSRRFRLKYSEHKSYGLQNGYDSNQGHYSLHPAGSVALEMAINHSIKPIAASLLRGVRLVTNNERYYDSLMPHLGQYAKSHKGHVIMGRNHTDTQGTRRPAISLPGQVSLMHSGVNMPLYGGAASGRTFHSDNWTPVFVAGPHYLVPNFSSPGTTGSGSDTIPDTDDEEIAIAKGMSFQIEPTGRATWTRGVTKSKFGDTWLVTTVAKERGDHTNYYEGRDRPHTNLTASNADQYRGQTLAEATGSVINQGSYSGSLSFPFEMSPRRMAGNQRYMLTAFTGTYRDANGVQVQPNMYFSRPRAIRQLLFRVGQDADPLLGMFKSYSDRVKIPITNGYDEAPTGRDGQGYTFAVLLGGFFGGRYRQISHLNAKGHTTGTYGQYKRSSRHKGATGFRYGLINTEPMNTSAVFRHDKFGQYRDMLEQRPYSRFFVRTPTTRRRRGMFRIRRRRRSNNIVTRGPVQIRFVSTITDRRIKPVRTYSQNLSHTATSSLPYFDADRDGKFRNRPFPFDESILDSAVIVEEDVD